MVVCRLSGVSLQAQVFHHRHWGSCGYWVLGGIHNPFTDGCMCIHQHQLRRIKGRPLEMISLRQDFLSPQTRPVTLTVRSKCLSLPQTTHSLVSARPKETKYTLTRRRVLLPNVLLPLSITKTTASMMVSNSPLRKRDTLFVVYLTSFHGPRTVCHS